jgi:hypothetical protein
MSGSTVDLGTVVLVAAAGVQGGIWMPRHKGNPDAVRSSGGRSATPRPNAGNIASGSGDGIGTRYIERQST